MEMRNIKILVPLLLFIAGGVFGIFSQGFIQTNNSLYYWFIIPAFVAGVLLAFALTLKYGKSQGGVALGRIAITIFVTALSYRAMQGYIIFVNCKYGQQKERELTGRVYRTDFPNPKRFFSKNSITIMSNGNHELIDLEVPGTDYAVGQVFTKRMMVGSLGILYSPN